MSKGDMIYPENHDLYDVKYKIDFNFDRDQLKALSENQAASLAAQETFSNPENTELAPRENLVSRLFRENFNLARLFNKVDVSADENGFVQAHVSFNQNNVINQGLPATLNNFVVRFDGLCELICNRVLMKDLLGKSGSENLLKKELTVAQLNNESVKKSHLLDVYSFVHRLGAFFLGIYPDNIFGITDQWDLVKKNKSGAKVNRELLMKGLDNIEDGTTLKLEIVKKSSSDLTGHSLLLKKVGTNDFIFFDPNSGEHRNLTKEDISNRIDEQLQLWQGTDVFLTRGDDYLSRLRENKIINVSNQNLPGSG